MSAEGWVAALALVGVLVQAVLGYVKDRNALAAAAPRQEVETSAQSIETQGKTLDRISKENERLARQNDKLEAQIESTASDARIAFALAKEQGERLDLLERKQQSAFRYIGQLVSAWPTTVVIPAIPDDLAEELGHLRWPMPPRPES